MSTLLSDRVDSFPASQTIAYTQKARELKAQGHDVISLSVGEPDFKTPAHIVEAAKKAIDEGFHGYPPVAGYPELKQAIVDKLKNENNISADPKGVVVSTGAKHSIANTIQCLVNPGDEVIVLAPYWVSYPAIVQLAGGTPVIVSGGIETSFKATATQIEAAITPKTKAIIYSSPCNPTGSVFSEAELKAIGQVLAKHTHVLAIADEIYELINFTDGYFSLGSIPEIADRVITINGLSKGYAMTGWRLGYLAGPIWLAKAVDKLQGQFTSGATSIVQRAAITALTAGNEASLKMREAFLKRRDLIVGLLKEIPGMEVNLPEGAFYVFPKISSYFGKKYQGQTIANSDDLCMLILNKAYVSVVPGQAFGAPECLRISYATSEDKIKEAIARISSLLNELE